MAFLDETDLAELWRMISEVDDALAADIALRVQVATGNYVGTGTYGSGNPNKLTFDFEPQLVIVSEGDSATHALFVRGTTVDCTNSGVVASWSGNTLSWYGTSVSNQLNQGAGIVPGQGNVDAKTYNYVAFGS